MKWNFLIPPLMFLLSSCVAGSQITAPEQTDPAAVTPSQRTDLPDLPDQGPAPELSNQIWINSDQPLRLADLRGKVILLEMWTFG